MDEDMVGLMADAAQAEERITIPENQNTNKEDIVAEEVELVGDETDYDRTPWDERNHEVEEPLQTETETETNTETSEEAATEETQESAPPEDPNEWLRGLPEAPPEINLPRPEFDDEGSLVNMTGQEFLHYTVELAKYEARIENYNNTVLARSMDTAEQILPDIKTNDIVRQAYENQLIAMTINGNGSAVDAARAVKALRGEAISEGKQSAKTSIEIQKNATVATPTNSQPTKPSKTDALAKRLRSGDRNASEDLFALWLDEGKI